jgi:hypothetical protein
VPGFQDVLYLRLYSFDLSQRVQANCDGAGQVGKEVATKEAPCLFTTILPRSSAQVWRAYAAKPFA